MLSRVGLSLHSVVPWSLLCVSMMAASCRPTYEPSVQKPVGPDGDPGGNDYTVQCSGWFPDWIARAAPPANAANFKLAQNYPLGVPVMSPDGTTFDHWGPPSPYTNAPWLAFDFHNPAQRLQYLEALKNYVLQDLVPYDFVPQNHTLNKRRWYHVPMMTSGFNPREPRHGVTAERALRASEQSWLNADVSAYGIGMYNHLGGYTIGQVFKDPEPSNSDPSKSQFIDGTVVFKILFAEYVPAAIVPGNNPLENAPEWQIQDPGSASNATFPVRFLQLDIAVKDPRSTLTGWVFATYVYDKSLPAATPAQRWHNLTPVGLQWGNDPDVTAPGSPNLDESWINPAVPAPFTGQVGLHGRLNGPVDNPASACMSCHSTAQVWTSGNSFGSYKAVGFVPDDDCTSEQKQQWFRNIPGSEPFGRTTGNNFCALTSPPLSSPPMYSLDYSLQVQLGLALGVAENHANPCIDSIPPEHLPAAINSAWSDLLSREPQSDARRFERPQFRESKMRSKRVDQRLPSLTETGLKVREVTPHLGESAEDWAIPPRSTLKK